MSSTQHSVASPSATASNTPPDPPIRSAFASADSADPDPFLALRAACSALDVIEASRIKVANALGLDGDGNPIPSRTGHVFEPVRMMIPDPDSRKKVATNMTPLIGLTMAETATRKLVVNTLNEVAPPRLLEWASKESGVGEITLARLLGEIGHPRHYQPMVWVENPDFDTEKPSSTENPKRLLQPAGPVKQRTLRMLWQYSRVGDPESHPRHFERRGVEVTQENLFKSGRPRVRSRLHVCADVIARQSFRFKDDPRVLEAIALVAVQSPSDGQLRRDGDDPFLDARSFHENRGSAGVETNSLADPRPGATAGVLTGPPGPKLVGELVIFAPCRNVAEASVKLSQHDWGRLRHLMDDIRPQGHGLIARTAAATATEEKIRAEVLELERQWKEIDAKWPELSSSLRLDPHADLYSSLPLAAVYLVRKASTEGRTHQWDCRQCKAQAGDPWRPGHRDMDARRFLAKELLRRIWQQSAEQTAEGDRDANA